MRTWLLLTVCTAGCGFSAAGLGASVGSDGAIGTTVDAPADGITSRDAPVDAPADARVWLDAPIDAPCWAFTPTNFDPCTLATAAPSLDLTAPLDSGNAPASVSHTQTDGSTVTIVHVQALSIAQNAMLTATGSDRLVIAVDGDVTITGNITSSAGANTNCATRAGTVGGAGTVAMMTQGGGGGGGGGGGSDAGGNGTNGVHGGAGAGGAKGTAATADGDLDPLLAGCPGAIGGSADAGNHAGSGGAGGGSIEISAQGTITVAGSIDVAGFGGKGGDEHTGGGGGGTGGAILLEASNITIAATANLCADGGAGGEGGGNPSPGGDGGNGKCDGAHPATSTEVAMFGGLGGNGGYKTTPAGGDATQETDPGVATGGGGGGGSVGWIRIRSVSLPALGIGAVITPTPQTN